MANDSNRAEIENKLNQFVLNHQPKYGVITTPPIPPTPQVPSPVPLPTIQPKYGAPTCPSPVSGVNGGSQVDIDITYDQLEQNIAMLKKSISSLKSSWDGETKRNVDILNNSWVGQDCVAYTERLTSMDGKVQNAISALELLCNTYEKASDMIRDNQNQVASSINNM